MLMQYALYDANGNIQNKINWNGTDEYTPPAGLQAVADTGNQAEIGGKYSNGTFTAPTPPTPLAPTTEQLVNQARALLQHSDVVMVRAFETGSSPDTSWVTYRSALRSFIASNGGGSLPTQPSYP